VGLDLHGRDGRRLRPKRTAGASGRPEAQEVEPGPTDSRGTYSTGFGSAGQRRRDACGRNREPGPWHADAGKPGSHEHARHRPFGPGPKALIGLRPRS